ncbi:hypothetical protein PoMZ_01694 [Pyricularia oryzae]|uniref:PD-(D/E)XK nuclease-like domain-containing protein n=1 Tax=Pyricularia oryzae TaxID=318829 RepID=A0A4P7N2U8_PYROR|nr:hypothetical protein PoMZ_01694 [Pyricularia oryzae]
MHYKNLFAPVEQTDIGGAVAERKLEKIFKIQILTAKCSNEKIFETIWNLEVYGPLFKLVITAIRGIFRHLITIAKIEPKWFPITRISPGPLISVLKSGSIRCFGNNIGGKMVDFALILDIAFIFLVIIKKYIYTSDFPANLFINQTIYNPLVLRPIGVNVETKVFAAGAEQGRI